MALILTVDRAAFLTHVDTVAATCPGLVPVVKGNGYGFGRPTLAALAVERLHAPEVAVGTVHELHDVQGARRIVLTPVVAHEVALAGTDDILTVGDLAQVATLADAGWQGAVVVKLASSMRRYGVEPSGLVGLLAAVERAGLAVHGVALHLPLAGSATDRADEAAAWLALLPEALALYVSHLDATTYAALAARWPGRRFHLRLGTALWLGDKSFLHLSADVVQVRRVRAGEHAGYRLVPAPCDGHLVMVSAGSTHGVTTLADGRSPFHFARERLALLEPPHMHTSMLVVPEGAPCPVPGDRVDVQRPLTQVTVDIVTNCPSHPAADRA